MTRSPTPAPARATAVHGPTRRRALRAAPVLAAAALAGFARAAPLADGDAAPAIDLQDQHGQPLRLGPATQRLLFSAERDVSDRIHKLLASEAAGVLLRQQTVYVSDLSAMPSLVTRLFALPRLRELPFAVGLVREPAEQAQVAGLPRRKGEATVLQLAQGRIRRIDFAADDAALRVALGLAP